MSCNKHTPRGLTNMLHYIKHIMLITRTSNDQTMGMLKMC
jgi:hypothetical protein